MSHGQLNMMFSAISHAIQSPDRPGRVHLIDDEPCYSITRRGRSANQLIAVLYRYKLALPKNPVRLADGSDHEGSIHMVDIISVKINRPNT
ncbi:hypothetical protein N825_35225 [Skermanella stibiiresistens SB22]|uniref:Uncharacterized protein n=2 Tax=Skermanella TaxID=204447 RepID=W9HA26_9PROT|nr:hypothetical protein N825_35225 [Skermanella stibiiresistens SB22]